MTERDPKRILVRRSDDGLAKAIELALTLALFTGIGWFIDRKAHTTPVFMIVGVLFGAVGMFVRAFYAYKAEMAVHDADAPWKKSDAQGSGA